MLGYFDPLKALIQNGVDFGFIHPKNVSLVTFIDCPEGEEDWDWGAKVVEVLDGWVKPDWQGFGFDWTRKGSKGGLDVV